YAHDLVTFGDLHVDVAEAYAYIGNQDAKVIEILEKLVDVPSLCNDKLFLLLGQAHEHLELFKAALDLYEKALQLQSTTNTIDPHMAWSALSICLRLHMAEYGLKLFDMYLKESVLNLPIRPHWVNTKSMDGSGKKSQGDDELEEDENDEDDDDDDDDEDEEDDAVPSWSDPSFSVDAMDNAIRLKLLIMYGRLHRATGNSEILCKVGIPIILLSLQQSKRLVGSRRLLRKMQRYYDEKSNKAIADNVQLNDPQTNVWLTMRATYLVNPEDPMTRNTLVAIAVRVTQQILVLKALSKTEHYGLIMDVGKALTESGNHTSAIELLTEVNCSDKVSDPQLRFNIRFLALATALSFKENRMAYEVARLNILEDPLDVGAWNLFCHIISHTGVFSWHQKFLAKILRDYPKCVPAMIMAGHRSSAYDISSLAVGELTLAHLELPEDPLILLCLGLAYLNLSMQRTVQDRQQSVAKSFAFLQTYHTKRMQQQTAMESEGFGSDLAKIEGWYNMARGYHQLELNHLAIALYERVLRYYDAHEVPAEYQLCREAAYNLSLIYKKSGAPDLAQYLLHKYLVVN
ncbi:transcription factor, partial [Thraustotheca clavata]